MSHFYTVVMLRVSPLVLLSLLNCALLSACGGSAEDGAAGVATVLIEDTRIAESSGLARSQRTAGIWWTHNDSGGEPVLYALDAQGRLRAELRLEGIPVNLDWEDLASYVVDGVAYLLVGDIGDNNGLRPFVQLFRLPEPALGSAQMPQQLTQAPDAVYTLVYPDGPRDAESLAVDAETQEAYLLSKRDAQPRLYRADLRAPAPVAAPQLMEALGPIEVPRAPADFAGRVDSFNFLTAMDFDDRVAVATSYLEVHLWPRAPGESWATAFSRPPRSAPLPDFPQIEAVALDAEGSHLMITSEQLPAPLARLPRP